MSFFDREQFLYEFYRSEKEFLNTMNQANLRLERLMINEYYVGNEEYEIIQEIKKESILKFIRENSQRIQAVWNKLKARIGELVTEKVLTDLKKHSKELNSDFQMKLPKKGFDVPNKKNFEELMDVKIVPFSNTDNIMMGDLKQDPKVFVKKHYGFLADDNKKMMEVAQEKCFTKMDNTKSIGKNTINDYIEVLEKASDYLNSIAEDIKKINSSFDVLDKVSAKLGESSISRTYGSRSRDFDYLFFNEAENEKTDTGDKSNDNTNNNEEKPSGDQFQQANKDNPTNTGQDKDDKKETDDLKKAIDNYAKISNSFLSVKMNIIFKYIFNAHKLVTEFIKLQNGGKNPTNDNSGGTDRVEVGEVKPTNKQGNQNNNEV